MHAYTPGAEKEPRDGETPTQFGGCDGHCCEVANPKGDRGIMQPLASYCPEFILPSCPPHDARGVR